MKKILFLTILLFSELLYSSNSAQIVIPKNNIKDFNKNYHLIEISSSNKNFKLKNSINQKIIGNSIDKNKKIIKIKIGNFTKTKRISKHNLNLFLKDTRFLNLKNPKIIKISKKLKKLKNISEKIKSWVYNYITIKTENIPFISATSILKLKAGDCTEHTILTVAILRSMKIPTKAVVGLIFENKYGKYKQIYVMHMWAKAYINNKWVIIDSTRNKQINYNRYIELTNHNLETETPIDYLKSIKTIKNISIKHLN